LENNVTGTKIYEQTIIGNNCAIHSGSVIGADGFGFEMGLLKNPSNRM
jgi:UDP-3-O-[3-hydroxymyristoyl] glucosamine N-acyltransferase